MLEGLEDAGLADTATRSGLTKRERLGDGLDNRAARKHRVLRLELPPAHAGAMR